MPNLNSVQIMGNLTRDVECRYTPSGTAVAEVGVAINRTWIDNGEKKQETTFVDCTLWAKTAELAGQYLHKGDPVFFQGRLQTESWDDKQTGQKRTRLKVVVESMQFLGGKQEGQSNQGGGQRQQRPPQREKPYQPPAKEDDANDWGQTNPAEDGNDVPF